jgi:hypothetical protein
MRWPASSASSAGTSSEDGEEGEDPDEGGRSGSVASVASSLRSYGFGVVTDDASGSEGGAADDQTGAVIRFSPDQAGPAATLARSLPGAVTEPEASGAGLLTLSLGEDFDGRVVSPTAAVPPAGPVAPVISAADTTCE